MLRRVFYSVGIFFFSGFIMALNIVSLFGVNQQYDAQWWKVALCLVISTACTLVIISDKP